MSLNLFILLNEYKIIYFLIYSWFLVWLENFSYQYTKFQVSNLYNSWERILQRTDRCRNGTNIVSSDVQNPKNCSHLCSIFWEFRVSSPNIDFKFIHIKLYWFINFTSLSINLFPVFSLKWPSSLIIKSTPFFDKIFN